MAQEETLLTFPVLYAVERDEFWNAVAYAFNDRGFKQALNDKQVLQDLTYTRVEYLNANTGKLISMALWHEPTHSWDL